MDIDPARAKSLFLSAADLPAADRADYLDRECGSDTDLRARVESLLKADEGFQATPAAMGNAADTAGPQPPVFANGAGRDGSANPFVAGQVIAGRYTLKAILGEGGMGTVYEAEQTEPVRRKVALKLIKPGMDTRQVVSRFNSERQALALMNHPNIARVYDGGATDAGQPFFVMELVVGVPLTQYCDRARLSVQERLELFVSVCLAVQHAHQTGIIHRDLKPNNILVTEVDGRPTPKVIDFGLARAIEPDLLGRSLVETGAIVGTPTYMAPEQAELSSSMQIDPRTDVYALGVMLYELLTGSPPLSPDVFRRAALLEMLRMVRDVDPPCPSTRVSNAETLPGVAATRNIDPDRLKRKLRGDLDWIVMKALEKDRSRRYTSATSFAADILRHLACDPVLAAPPSRAYRLRRFLRKNRRAVIVVNVLLPALLLGAAGTGFGLIRARRSRAQAREAAERVLQAESDRIRSLAQLIEDQDSQIKPRLSVLGPGFGGPRGVAIDRAHNVYVADTRNNLVKRISPDGAVHIIGSGFATPFRVAVGSGGDVFVADTGNNAVKQFRPDGTISTIASGLANPWAVAVDAAGNVFVADTGNDAVKEIRPDGTIRTIGSGFSHPQAVAVDRSGNVFVADYGNGAIKKVLPDGQVKTVVSAVIRPCGMAVDATGDLFFTESGRRTVKELLPNGTIRIVVILLMPTSLAVDDGGNVFVADPGGNEVVELSPPAAAATRPSTTEPASGADLPELVQLRIGPGFLAPNALAVDATGDVLVSDRGNELVKRIRRDGSIQVVGDGKIWGTGLRVDAAGNIFLVNAPKGLIYKISPDGAVKTIVPERASAPVGVGVDAAGNLYLACRRGKNVVEVTAEGKFIRVFGSEHRGPYDVTVGASGEVYVAEAEGQAVRVYSPEGVQIKSISARAPYKVALDAKGNLFIACSGDGTIRKVLPTGEQITLGAGLKQPNGIAVDAAGHVYGCDLLTNQVYAVPP